MLVFMLSTVALVVAAVGLVLFVAVVVVVAAAAIDWLVFSLIRDCCS